MNAYYKGELIGGSPGGGSAEEAYSTEETRIGTWIDGKPLYRKVYTGVSGNTLNAGKVIANLSDLSIDQLVHFEPIIQNAIGHDHAKYPASSNGWDSLIASDGNEPPRLVVAVSNDAFFNRPVTIVLEYTKTTD